MEKAIITSIIGKAADVDSRAAEAVQAFASGLASGIEIGRQQAAQEASEAAREKPGSGSSEAG